VVNVGGQLHVGTGGKLTIWSVEICGRIRYPAHTVVDLLKFSSMLRNKRQR